MKFYTVYGIYSMKEEKIIYVGCTKKFKKRKAEHIRHANPKNKLSKKIQKIQLFMRENDFETFSFIKLFEGECNQEDVYEKEKYFIKNYDTFRNGLNENEGGNSVAHGKHNPNARRVICETTGEVFDSVMDASKSKGIDYGELSSHVTGSRYKNGIGKRKLGRPHFFKYLDREGDKRNISQEYRNKMSELTKKRNTKKVLNKTTGETYDSLKQAAEKLDVNYTRLSTHVKGTLIIKNFPYELEYIDTKENQ